MFPPRIQYSAPFRLRARWPPARLFFMLETPDQSSLPKNFHPVAKLEDLAPGRCLCVEIGEIEVALCNVEGTIHALDNVCPHAGGPLGEGVLAGAFIKCPWHGWRFHVQTGERPENPDFAVSRYPVYVENGIIYVSPEPYSEPR